MPVRRRRGRAASGAVRPHHPHQSHGLRPLQGQRRSGVPEPKPVPAPHGGRPAAVRGPRPAPGDPLVPPPDLRGPGAGPAGVRAVLLAALPAAGRLPGANGVRLRAAQRSPGGGGLRAAPTLLIFGDHPRLTDPAAAAALVAANGQLERVTIECAGDLPQLEQPDETAAVVEGFLRR